MEGKLNGAYYGPPIPPARDNRSIGRRRSGCGCLLCSLVKFVVSFVVTLGIIVFVFWLVFRPNKLNVYVEDAALTQFSLSNSTSQLAYALTANISVRNPNRRIGIYYDYLEARAFYAGNRLASDWLPTFYQGHKNTSFLHPAFSGQQLVAGNSLSAVRETYGREKGEGSFYVEIDIKTKIRIKIWIFKIHRFRPEIDCMLKLPVPSPATGSSGAGAFQRTKCHFNI